MRKFLIILAIAICGFCNAQTANVLSVPTVKSILETFCLNCYSSCFEGKVYIPQSIIIKSVGVDPNNGGTSVNGIHSYQGQYIPFVGRKTHNDVQFKATIFKKQDGYRVIFHKYIERDLMHRSEAWETGKGLIK